MPSPVGDLRLVTDGDSLTGVDFLGEMPAGGVESRSVARFSARAEQSPRGERADEHPLLREAARQLAAYFAGSCRLRPAARAAGHRLPAAGVGGAAADRLRRDRLLRRARRAARAHRPWRPRRRHRQRPQPDPGGDPVPPRRRCHRLADRLRRRDRAQALPARPGAAPLCSDRRESRQARRRDSESRSAAARTAGACIRPGWRVRRSSGPETETAAITLPEGERTGADTEATPASRSPTDCAQPRLRIAGERGGGEGRVLQPLVHQLGVLPGQQHLGGGPGAHRQLRADGDGVAQPRGALGRGHADPVVTLAAPQLGGLAGDVAQPRQHRAGGGEQPVLAGGRARARRAGDRARTGPARRAPPAGGARARRPGGGRWDGRVRSMRPVRPASRDHASSAVSTRAALSRTPTPLELSII